MKIPILFLQMENLIFSSYDRKKTGMFVIVMTILHYTGGARYSNKSRKRIKSTKIGKEDAKLSLFVGICRKELTNYY